MDVDLKIKKLASKLGLFYKAAGYNYILCSKKEIIIRNFLGGCPDPSYIEYKHDPELLKDFLQSSDFKRQTKQEQGCVIDKSAIKRESKKAQKIVDANLRRDILKFYLRLQKKIKKNKELALIYSPKDYEKTVFQEVPLHEYIHLLLDKNKSMRIDGQHFLKKQTIQKPERISF